MVRHEPWQQIGPHYDVAIVHPDLLDAPERNAGGTSDPHVLAAVEPNLAAVLSMHRLRRIPDHDDRRMAVRRLATRSFGQVLDLPGVKRTQAVDLVHGRRVCTNVCVMRAAPAPPRTSWSWRAKSTDRAPCSAATAPTTCSIKWWPRTFRRTNSQ